jgi:hypothetical protein
MRRRAPAAALVEQQHAVLRGVEEAPVFRRAAAARAAVQEHRGFAVRVSAHLPVDLVAIAGVEHAGLEGLDRRIELRQ